MTVSLGNDHFGYPMKEKVIEILESMDVNVIDNGCYSLEMVDFPDVAKKLCADVLNGKADRGIMICGTGVGASIAANKIPGIRAALCHDVHCAHQCVEHDNVNVLCIGAQIIGAWLAEDIIRAFISAKFSDNEDFRRRVKKLDEMDLAGK